MSSNARILCVDDEPHVIEGLKRSLRRSFEVTGAIGPEEGLKILEASGPFAAIVSDLNMPGMSGVEFFEASRRIAPDAARILLTGQADLNAAMDAVNRGAVFRFLLKPCAPDVLLQALQDGVKKYEWHMKERSLLARPLLRSETSSEAPADLAGSDGSEATPATGRDALQRFLVVDPSATTRRMLINALARLGYTEVLEASTGQEALRAFGASIRCVITEWDLPQSSGPDLIRALRARPDGRTMPVLMITTRSTRADILDAREAGVNGYVVKPFTLPLLKEKLDAALSITR